MEPVPESLLKKLEKKAGDIPVFFDPIKYAKKEEEKRAAEEIEREERIT